MLIQTFTRVLGFYKFNSPCANAIPSLPLKDLQTEKSRKISFGLIAE